jgi:hypothetical protein
MENSNGTEKSQVTEKPANSGITVEFPKIPHSRIFKFVIIFLVELILLVGIFSLGVNIGFKKANFTSAWTQNYINNFGEKRTLIQPPPSGAFFNPHGLDGTILSIDKNTLVIKDEDSTEKTVLISPSTVIRLNFQNLQPSDIKNGEEIIIIGEANPQGQIDAKLIRVLEQK